MTESNLRIGGWMAGDILGHGTFASVYRVAEAGRDLALKWCTTDNAAARTRMELEIFALRNLAHPNIPEFIGQGEAEGRPYFVMSLARGRSLLQRIQDNEAVGALEGDISALDILVKLLSVLAHVHSRGFVHRDIKDANIISLFPDRVVTLIDFGFCKRVNERSLRSDDSFWRAGAPRFSPPTKLSHPSLALPSHDVFAVGVVGYRLLSGRYPWSVADLRRAHLARSR